MKQKQFLLLAATLLTAGTLAGVTIPSVRFAPKTQSPRIVKLSPETKIEIAQAGKARCEIVVPPGACRNLTKAGNELANYLNRIIGSKVAIVRQPSGSIPAFILGQKGAELAKIDLSKIDRDGFIIQTVGQNIVIAGNDDAQERGTLYGVYEFLERFGGVRFYFPGEYGTIVPRKADWSLPGINIFDRPDSQYRRTYCTGVSGLGDGKVHFYEDRSVKEISALSEGQLRLSTLSMPNCHGFSGLGLVERFAKTHPEYFALKDNGKRYDGSVVTRPSDRAGHVCLSSEGLKEEIFQDAKAFLTGKSAEERGVLMPNGKYYWSWSRFILPFFNIMPNDCHYPCKCAGCKDKYTSGPQVSSNFVWKFKTDIARRLQKEKVPGFVTMMAYANYVDIPNVDIPSNVIVMLAQTGPWNELNPNQGKCIELLKAWKKKLGTKPYLWNYTTKCGNLIADIPGFTPKAVGSYLKKVAPYSFGTFLESETDYWLFNFMNFYVFSKVMWNAETDVDALMAEHLNLMYGPAAPQMKEFYDTLERHWLKDIMSNIRDTDAGPQAVLPSQFDIWNKLYGPQELERLNKLFDQAEKATAKNKDALKRVKFMRRELLGKILNGAKNFNKSNADLAVWTIYAKPVSAPVTLDGKLDEEAWKKADTVWMTPRLVKDNAAEVHTRIKMLADKEYFYVGIECDEPHTDKMVCAKRKFDEINTWQDNLVELFFAPDHQSELLYQIMLNSSGNVCDLRDTPGNQNTKWNSNMQFKIGIVPGKMWVAEMKIPRKSMPEITKEKFTVNFTRGRILDNGIKVKVPYYTWSPFRKQSAEQCGTAVIGEKPASESVIINGDFAGKVSAKRFLYTGKSFWCTDKILHLDREVFRTCGQAARLEPVTATSLAQYIDKKTLKRNTRYQLSFFISLKDVVPAKSHPRTGVNIDLRFGNKGTGFVFYPFKQALQGTIPWTRFSFEFKTPDAELGELSSPFLRFNLHNKATGKVWIDHVEIVEIK